MQTNSPTIVRASASSGSSKNRDGSEFSRERIFLSDLDAAIGAEPPAPTSPEALAAAHAALRPATHLRGSRPAAAL